MVVGMTDGKHESQIANKLDYTWRGDTWGMSDDDCPECGGTLATNFKIMDCTECDYWRVVNND